MRLSAIASLNIDALFTYLELKLLSYQFGTLGDGPPIPDFRRTGTKHAVTETNGQHIFNRNSKENTHVSN